MKLRYQRYCGVGYLPYKHPVTPGNLLHKQPDFLIIVHSDSDRVPVVGQIIVATAGRIVDQIVDNNPVSALDGDFKRRASCAPVNARASPLRLRRSRYSAAVS